MDSLPIELITSVAASLEHDDLSKFSRAAKKYHAALTKLLYECVFKCNTSAGHEDHKDHKCEGYDWPCIQAWYDAFDETWLGCSKIWESDPVIEAFAAHPLDQITIPNYEGITLLHYYAAHGNTKLVGVFLRKGMRVDSTASCLSLTPLHCAVTGDGKLDTIEYLLSKGADLESRDADGRTSLFFAINCLTFTNIICEVEESVFEHLDDPRIEDTDNEKLMLKRLRTVQFLLDHGADLSVSTKSKGHTPLMFASTSSSFELCQTLVSAACLKSSSNISTQSKLGATALHCALVNDQVKNANLLVQNGADILIPDNKGLTAIDILVSEKFPCPATMLLDLADTCVEFGPSRRWRLHTDPQSQLFLVLRRRNMRNMTSLHILLKFWAAGRIKLDIHGPDGTGPSPLHYLCGLSFDMEWSMKAIRVLLDAGATVDLAGANNCSLYLFMSLCPMFTISQITYYKTLGMLIDSTSNLNAPDFAGNAALHFAASTGEPKVVFKVLTAMRAQGVEPLRNNNGFTPLHIAAGNPDSFDILRLFLKRGLEIDSRTNDGETVLHVAVRNCNAKAVEKLLALGADFTLVDNEGHTPLHKATIATCVAPLIDAGCERHANCEWCPGSWWDNFLESQRELQEQAALEENK